ncbi:hypothetical protein HPP92_006909 [Vanilla planifolia]|uniref:RING-type E3 ubiquitin transferase n=1 Tax=Vanilla planifolia TaxID=51239 RepID=A0A835RCV9_VANPL|nr:hypothetical protein HPP92_006909 [Vanilla planifolia]
MDQSPSDGGKSLRIYALSGRIMISAIVVLFAIVLLILFLHLYVRWHVIRRASRRARRRMRLVFAGADQTSSGNHGLDPSVLASLPMTLFCSDGNEEDELGECAVCLNEFTDGEKIRGLPRCGHRFHVDCIDMWFCSHSTCPLCRSEVEAMAESEPREGNAFPEHDPETLVADASGTDEGEGSSSSDSGDREVRIEIPAGRVEDLEYREDQLRLRSESLGNQPLKPGSSRMGLIWWLLMRDPRLHMCVGSASEHDLERGDGTAAPPPPPPPPPR